MLYRRLQRGAAVGGKPLGAMGTTYILRISLGGGEVLGRQGTPVHEVVAMARLRVIFNVPDKPWQSVEVDKACFANDAIDVRSYVSREPVHAGTMIPPSFCRVGDFSTFITDVSGLWFGQLTELRLGNLVGMVDLSDGAMP